MGSRENEANAYKKLSASVQGLQGLLAAIEPVDRGVIGAALRYIDTLTKPVGSLGRLEELAAELAGMTGTLKPELGPPAVLIMAADHGVAAEGVSAYPQEVTVQMVANFLRGGAAVNVFARRIGADVTVVDVGVAGEVPGIGDAVAGQGGGSGGRLLRRKIRPGTGNLRREPAMSREEAVRAVEAGAEAVREAAAAGARSIVCGEMGIGNTTAASAVVAAFSGLPADRVTGPGTGVGPEGLALKRQVVGEALALHKPDPADPLDVLARVGGLELAGLSGVMLQAAALRLPVLVDGFICTAAALIAARLSPPCAGYMIAGHLSPEPGHRIALELLGRKPLLDLQLRLGEGSGAVLAFPLAEAAAAMLREMATFDSAGVSGRG